MTRQTKRLTDRRIAALKKPDRYPDGDRLYLVVDEIKSGLSKRWTFLYKFRGKQREPGLGAYPKVSLAEARAKAGEYRTLLDRGIDPLAAKQAASDARKTEEARKTFGQCADALFKSKVTGKAWRSAEHAKDWLGTLTEYCKPIWNTPIESAGTKDVLEVLTPVWTRVPETASRLRGRIESVIAYATAHGYRTGPNPAAWRGHMENLLTRRHKLSRGHHPALAYDEVPGFVTTLRESTAPHAKAFEFLILTATRSNEALGARWNEIDLAAKVWVVPACRMKSGAAHRVPLSMGAMVILEKQAAIRSNDFVFPGIRRGRPVSASALRRLHPKGATIHGMRSSFRDWCGEETSLPREVAEAALAHSSGDATERSYHRGDALEKRRALMEAWASFCEPGAASNIIHINKAVQKSAV